ncbi:MAG: hypothetical protein B6241_14620 [Spirochaetaceae bacterium 4572_59]|nr:MAG: hypothetical protein B6241_14620 [Spirochaetaceae bacterium 4572_59]
MSRRILISMEKIFFNYKQRLALRGVDFKLYGGEVHGLIGEHRAGKSSLVNLLAGAAVPESGRIRIGENIYNGMTPKSAMKEGISIVFQNNNVIPDYNAVEYLFSGQPIKTWWGKLQHKEMHDKAVTLFNELQYPIDLTVPLYKLTVAQQHMVEFARTLIFDSQIIILDEIAQKLTPGEMKIIYATMKRLKEKGVSFIYISHDLDEILRVSDEITILNNGIRIGTEKTSTLDKYKLFELSYSYSVEQENRDEEKEKIFLRNVLESATLRITEGFLVLEDKEKIFYLNPTLNEIFPEILSSWQGKKISEVPFPLILDNNASNNDTPDEDRQIFLDDGRIIRISEKSDTYLPGLKESRIILFQDITLQSGLNNYMEESEKYASLAELAVGVAHEINNPLFIIKNHLKLIQMKGGNVDGTLSGKLSKMEKELDRIGGIVSNLLSFSKVQKHQEPFDLNLLLQDVTDLIHHKLVGKKINFSLKLLNHQTFLYGNPNRLKQVFLNILINSLEAVLMEGNITVEVMGKGKRVMVYICDNGCGIDDSVKKKIYNPFFSTKITRNNTGLGLAISQNIVQEFEGDLSFESQPGMGTSFCINLPLYDPD